MSVAAVLADLTGRGIALWREGDRLCFEATGKDLPQDLLDILRTHKAGLLAIVAEPRREMDEIDGKPEPADDLEATALLGEVFWARQDAARSALAGAPDGGTRIATYRAAIARWAAYLDGLADQGPGRDALEWAAIGQLRRLQRGEVVPREQEAIA